MTKRLTLIFVIGIILVTIPTLPASSACHRFFFSPTSYTVNEGAGAVAVNVERDATVAPSQVKISTIEGTAKAGQDFGAFQGQIVVFQSEKVKAVPVSIVDDNSNEGAESFRLRLSEPSNAPPPNAPCPNQQYVISPADDATVAIQDNDAAPPPPPAAVSPKASPSPSPTRSPSPSPSPQQEESPSPAEEESPTPGVVTTQAADEGDDGGLPTGVVIATLAAIVAGGAGAGLLYLRRRGATPAE